MIEVVSVGKKNRINLHGLCLIVCVVSKSRSCANSPQVLSYQINVSPWNGDRELKPGTVGTIKLDTELII